MRTKRILWLLAALMFANVVYAQTRGGASAEPATPTQNQTQPNGNEVQMQSEAKGAKAKGQAQGPTVMTEKEVVKEIKNSPAEKVISDVDERGVDFDMAPDKEKKLRKAGATDAVITAVRNAGPTVRRQTAKMIMGPGAAGVQQIPKEQAQAFEALKGELDPDKAVALVDDFIKKYPSSPLISYVDYFGANAYQQKNDAEKTVQYCDDCLKAKSDNLMCLILKVSMVPQPQYINAHDADRDKILPQAENEASRALELIKQLPKNATESDADYQKRLGDIASEVHGSLGMVHLDLATGSLTGVDKAELAKAEQEFKTSVTTAQKPSPVYYFRLGEVCAMEGKVDDGIEAFSKASDLGQGTLIKTYADQKLEALKKQKSAMSATPSH